jgi:hypothetical protein
MFDKAYELSFFTYFIIANPMLLALFCCLVHRNL